MIEEVSNVKFERVLTENGGVNMCKGMEEYTLKTKVETAIGIYRDMNLTEEEIAETVAKRFNVTVEYVKNLMMPKAV